MKDLIKPGCRVGCFLALLFVACFAWFWIRPVHQGLHMQLMELSFFGFSGLNFMSFLAGLIQSFIWGSVGVALWRLSGECCSRCGCS